MTSNELGKQLLQSSKLGDVDDVKMLMSNGAPFSTDWVSGSGGRWFIWGLVEVAVDGLVWEEWLLRGLAVVVDVLF